ncbi:MAG: hypothetical protein K9G46_07040 [Flavobacteriales bacterium]|jgi:hypothetical protein|nr:hypothetical protein [Flavobacteriales bacterium]
MNYNTINKVKKILRSVVLILLWMLTVIGTIHVFGPIPKSETERGLIIHSIAIVALVIFQFGFHSLVEYRKAINDYDQAESRADKAYREAHQLREQIQELKKERSEILKQLQIKAPKK